jgi:carbon storage regulator
MLVISRRLEESLVIGDNVVVTVVEVRGNRVRLGVKAPPNVEIARPELMPVGRFAAILDRLKSWARAAAKPAGKRRLTFGRDDSPDRYLEEVAR